METKKCSRCGKEYKQYKNKKTFLQDYKASIGCQKCGEKRGYCLDFHHIDPSIKDADIARMTSNKSNINDILAEAQKCIVLCANCHREFHFLEHNNGLLLEDYLK